MRSLCNLAATAWGHATPPHATLSRQKPESSSQPHPWPVHSEGLLSTLCLTTSVSAPAWSHTEQTIKWQAQPPTFPPSPPPGSSPSLPSPHAACKYTPKVLAAHGLPSNSGQAPTLPKQQTSLPSRRLNNTLSGEVRALPSFSFLGYSSSALEYHTVSF